MTRDNAVQFVVCSRVHKAVRLIHVFSPHGGLNTAAQCSVHAELGLAELSSSNYYLRTVHGGCRPAQLVSANLCVIRPEQHATSRARAVRPTVAVATEVAHRLPLRCGEYDAWCGGWCGAENATEWRPMHVTVRELVCCGVEVGVSELNDNLALTIATLPQSQSLFRPSHSMTGAHPRAVTKSSCCRRGTSRRARRRSVACRDWSVRRRDFVRHLTIQAIWRTHYTINLNTDTPCFIIWTSTQLSVGFYANLLRRPPCLSACPSGR